MKPRTLIAGVVLAAGFVGPTYRTYADQETRRIEIMIGARGVQPR
jgi:hypothetical protein